MAIAIGTLIYFTIQLALGIIAGKLLQRRGRQEPATRAAIFVGRTVPLPLANGEHLDLVA